MEHNIDDNTASDLFPLSDLPTEVVLHVIKCLDERETSASFPTGPSVSRTKTADVPLQEIVFISRDFPGGPLAVERDFNVHVRSMPTTDLEVDLVRG